MSRVVLEGLKRVARARLRKSPRHVAIAALMRASSILVQSGDLTLGEEQKFIEFLAWFVAAPPLPPRKTGTTKKKKRTRHSRLPTGIERFALTHRRGRADRTGTARREEPGRKRKKLARRAKRRNLS